MSRRVAVTGFGCVSALGQGAATSWAALKAGQGGIRPMSRQFGDNPAYAYQGPAAYIEKLDVSGLDRRFGARALAHVDPFSAYAQR